MNCSSEDPTCKVFPSTNLTEQESEPLDFFRISLFSISLLFGLPTHSYVIWLIVTGTGNGVASEFFNLNLSVCEVILSLYSLINLLRMIPIRQTQVLLILAKFLSGNMITIRPVFQCLMCVERYLAVVHPVTFLKYKPLRYRVICSTAVWITGLGSCVLCIFIILSHHFSFMWFSLLQFLVFLSIQLFCLVAVLRALKQSGPGERGREREEENHMKRRAFYLILILTVPMLILFLPFVMRGFFYILLQQDTQVLSLVSLYCFVLGGFVRALLFLWRVRKLPFFKHP
ncbi:G-protein coupled receptor 4-like [Siphateles boraxobius]|uniref:G-protein coupled receptor 4-like n=1 Tax=Siphateles boraxobius TaxID=180520 RepID=UPI0040637A04